MAKKNKNDKTGLGVLKKQVWKLARERLYKESFHAACVGVIPFFACPPDSIISDKQHAKLHDARDKGFIAGAEHVAGMHNDCPTWHDDPWEPKLIIAGLHTSIKRHMDAITQISNRDDVPEELKGIKLDLARAEDALQDAYVCAQAAMYRTIPEEHQDDEIKAALADADKQNDNFSTVKAVRDATEIVNKPLDDK